MQLGPIPKPSSVWIFGDGKSWGQMIEHKNAIQNQRDAIARVAKDFSEWVFECAEIFNEPQWKVLARRFELRMVASPKDIFQLLKVINKQSDLEILVTLNNFMK